MYLYNKKDILIIILNKNSTLKGNL